MASWAEQELKANPSAHIGCIIPNLAQNRDKIWRVFIDTFAAEYLIPGQTSSHFRTHGLSFNLSAGEAFSQINLIKTALTALKLTLKTEWPIDRLYELASPAYCQVHPQDAFVAADLDCYLRERGDAYCDASTLKIAEKLFAKRYADSTLITRLLNLFTIHKGYHYQQHWAETTTSLLNQLGWPGNRSLNSSETQMLQRWRQLLLQFMSLAEIDGKISWHKAVETIDTMAAKIIFQPRTDYTPIQVLGTLEAAGSEFDKIWLMGLTDDIWPPKPSPNPLLPFSLQQKYKLPHSTSERELVYCQNVYNRILQAATETTISFAEYDGDQPLTPSPLIAKEIAILKQKTVNSAKKYSADALEIFSDDYGPALQADETIRGGSYLLQQQEIGRASCRERV